MFTGIYKYVIITMVIMLITLGGAGWIYFKHSQSELATLRQNAAQLEQAVQTQQRTIQAQQEAQERSRREVLQLQNRLSSADRTRRDLEVRLRQQNWEAQARTRRPDTEREINHQLQSQWRTFETMTGHVPSSTPTSPSASVDGDPPPRAPVRGAP